MVLLFGMKQPVVLARTVSVLMSALLRSLAAGVKRLSVSELNELLEEIETAIKEYSEELVQQLALRDELEFEKEVKNSFISVLIEVQNKQKEHKETTKKKKKLKNGSSQNGKNERSHMPGTVSDVLQEAWHPGNGFHGNPSTPSSSGGLGCPCRSGRFLPRC